MDPISHDGPAKRSIGALAALTFCLTLASCAVVVKPDHRHSRRSCHSNEYWDGHKCKHKGRAKGHDKDHDHRDNGKHKGRGHDHH